MTQVLLQRIQERLAALGMSERKASILATGQPDTIRYIRARGVTPSATRLTQLAMALQTTESYLLGHGEGDTEQAYEPPQSAKIAEVITLLRNTDIPADVRTAAAAEMLSRLI